MRFCAKVIADSSPLVQLQQSTWQRAFDFVLGSQRILLLLLLFLLFLATKYITLVRVFSYNVYILSQLRAGTARPKCAVRLRL